MSTTHPTRDRSVQRKMYRELREQATRAQVRRQQKIARLLAQNAGSGRNSFRHPNR